MDIKILASLFLILQISGILSSECRDQVNDCANLQLRDQICSSQLFAQSMCQMTCGLCRTDNISTQISSTTGNPIVKMPTKTSTGCSSNPCQNRGYCMDTANGYICKCGIGFFGTNCETANNVTTQVSSTTGVPIVIMSTKTLTGCSSTPCQNGAYCMDTANGYTCKCGIGFFGTNCEIAHNVTTQVSSTTGTPIVIMSTKTLTGCSSTPCQNGGYCMNTANGYTCKCDIGFFGTNCEIANNVTTQVSSTTGTPIVIMSTKTSTGCSSSPCQNRGYCMDTANGYTCKCGIGFFGTNCEIANNVTTQVSSTTGTPIVIMSTKTSTGCSSSPCQNRGYCMDTANGYTCKCGIGFFGTNCENDIDACVSAPCQNAATCVDEFIGYLCICASGYTGTNCETNSNDCIGSTCQHGGTCVDGINTYTCKCPHGYSGLKCETRVDIDDCASAPCMHGGTCVDGNFTYTCQCTDYYKGGRCQTRCGSVKADIVMVLDSSGNIGSRNFQILKNFTALIAKSFVIGPTNVHMSVVTFSSSPHVQFQLNSYQNQSSLVHAINSIRYHAGATHTSQALDYVLKHTFTPNHGDRIDASNIAVIITDGKSVNAAATFKEAQLMHLYNLTTIAIGIGGGINLLELSAIASNRSLVFPVPNYDALHTLQGLIGHDICEAHLLHTQMPSTIYSTPPNIVTATCADKLSNCYQYGFQSCDDFRQWASENCPKYCQFCKVPVVSSSTPGPMIVG